MSAFAEPTDPFHQASTQDVAAGPSHCGEPECDGQPLATCEYVDSRGRACRTVWCSRHRREVGGLTYCRRHAGTIGALGSKANNPRALPDVSHRGASLVRWMYRDLDPRFTALLDSLSGNTDHLLRDSEVAVTRRPDGSRAWEMGWKLASPAGIRLRISLMVEEADDSIVLVRLGDEVVASGTPPWIEARRRGETLSDDEDAEQRRQFYGFIGDFLGEALHAAT